jgi:hypothetical protein
MITTTRREDRSMIVKRADGWHLLSIKKDANGKRRNLGGPYKSRGQAVKREQQVEYFKHQGK